MSGTVHAFEFMEKSPCELPVGICPVFGSDRFLQNLVIRAIRQRFGDEAGALIELDGTSCGWADLLDEIHSSSLFQMGSNKIVVVDHADSFVKQHRSRLENLHAEKFDAALILLVDSWASNTKLYKMIDADGLQICCDAPSMKRGRGKQRDEASIIKWLCDRAANEYEFKLNASCASVLIELTDCNFGRMDQELAKLSLYADEKLDFQPLQVKEIIGGWPAQTMWSAMDAALDGRAGHAVELLHQLFAAGEHPLAMFGQIAWSLRRYAEVGERVSRDSRLRRRINLNESLKQAGFRAWGNELNSASARLKQLGRNRVGQLLDWIVETDLALKRSHAHVDRGRLKLEELIVRMAEELGPQSSVRR